MPYFPIPYTASQQTFPTSVFLRVSRSYLFLLFCTYNGNLLHLLPSLQTHSPHLNRPVGQEFFLRHPPHLPCAGTIHFLSTLHQAPQQSPPSPKPLGRMSYSCVHQPRGCRGRASDPGGRCRACATPRLQHRRSNCKLRPYAQATTSLLLEDEQAIGETPASPMFASPSRTSSSSSSISSTPSTSSSSHHLHGISKHIRRPRLPSFRH